MNMLTEEEISEIAAEARNYQDKNAVCIEALKVVQKHRGWISNQLLQDVAELLKMTPDELDSVATFYNLLFRKPVGRHVILVCDSVSCWITGYEQIRKHLQSKLEISPGGTTADRRFTLLPIVCLGACGGAPAMMIDGNLHENLDPAKIDTILESYP
jgi:NADH-quinone oxidoreductase subunit E